MSEARVSQSVDLDVGSLQAPRKIRSQDIAAKSITARNRLIKKVVVVLGVVTVLALFCVWSRLQVLQIGYENSRLQNQISDLADTIKRMDLEIARLKSPSYLGAVAAERLGMSPPTSGQLVIIKDSSENPGAEAGESAGASPKAVPNVQKRQFQFGKKVE